MNEKTMTWVGRVLSGLVVLMLLGSAGAKLSHAQQMVDNIGKFGFEPTILGTLGAIELSVAVLYAIPQTAVLGAILVAAYFGGAICTHLRVHDPIFIPLVIGILAWLGIWLREPRLRAVLPLRKP